MKEQGRIDTIKIIDWEVARKYNVNNNMTYKLGYNAFKAPEVFKSDYNYKCDLWSLGCIMYYLLCGRKPFEGNTNDDIQVNI